MFYIIAGDFFMIKHIRGRAIGNALLSVLVIFAACGVAYISAGEANKIDTSGEVSDSLGAFDLPVIVIDPGHGGADCGAVGVNGTLEKDINLRLSLYLAREFENAGYIVKLTRTEDIMLVDGKTTHTTKKSSDLTARTQIAAEGEIFISIHMNKFPQEKYSGAQIYYSENDPRSARLAEMLQQGIKSSLQPDNNREVKSGAGLYLLDRIKSPAVIAECGFISNPNEADRLNDDEYLKQMAFEIFSAADDFVIECMDNDT